MIFISYLIGFSIGWYIAYKKYAPTRAQINKSGSKNNIQIGTINFKEEE